jgi:hypothetical protein
MSHYQISVIQVSRRISGYLVEPEAGPEADLIESKK